MTTYAHPFLCLYCTRYHDPMRSEKFSIRYGSTCDAFPKGIPDAILDNEVDHRHPVKGDGGMRFVGKGGGDGIGTRLDQLFAEDPDPDAEPSTDDDKPDPRGMFGGIVKGEAMAERDRKRAELKALGGGYENAIKVGLIRRPD